LHVGSKKSKQHNTNSGITQHNNNMPRQSFKAHMIADLQKILQAFIEFNQARGTDLTHSGLK
jgi:hypothetical protein